MTQQPQQLALHAPPQRPESEGPAGVLLNVVPMLGSLGSIVLVSSLGGENRARGLVAAGMILFASVGFVLVQVSRQRTQRARRQRGSRGAYLRHLDRARMAARLAARSQRDELTQRFPAPIALPAVASQDGGRWGGGDAAPAVLLARYGECPQPLALALVPPEEEADGGDPRAGRVDPAARAALARLLAVHRVVPGLPATLDLGAFTCVEVCGDAEPARALARALLCSATSGHAPERLAVAVLSGTSALPLWDWVKWLPHARSPRLRDAVGATRMVGADLAELIPMLGDGEAGRPHLLLLVDGADAPSADSLAPLAGRAVTLLRLAATWEPVIEPGALRLELVGRQPPGDPRQTVLALRSAHPPGSALADACSLTTAEAFARRLAPLPAGELARADRGAPATAPDVGELLGLGDVRALDAARRWAGRGEADWLRVPIGVSDDGATVHLDLKEAARRGMGPHGLLVGATGSGKSELLRTLVLGLAVDHPPDRLTLVLVDFKGGATFAGLADLPHVSALITNLESDLALVDRMQDALLGELTRRQEALRASGHVSVRDRELAREAGATGPGGTRLDPMPDLVIVVDEFSEMLAAKPEFLDLFVAVGRLGRSLGLHLLLASQRLEEGRLRGLEAHLSYRIGLRTFSEGESRTVLGVPDAAALPGTPGVGYLRPAPGTLVPFRAAYSSGPARLPPVTQVPAEPLGVIPFSVAPASPVAPASSVQGAASAGPVGIDPRNPSVLDVVVGRLARLGTRARRIWLPPLDLPDSLGGFMPDLVEDPTLGLVSRSWRERGPLVVPVGTVDRPRVQRRDILTVDLRKAGGHLAVVGAPRSGKSTLLACVVGALALTTTPQEVQLLVLDLGGGALADLVELPHVAGTATRTDPEVVRRVVAEAVGIVQRREASRRPGRGDGLDGGWGDGWGDGWGEVFVVADGWSTLRDDFEDLEGPLQEVAMRGPSHGVHLLAAATRWADLRPAVRGAFGTRLELRLGDPLDSEVDRGAAARVPAGRPGRGLTQDAEQVLTALPVLSVAPARDAGGGGRELAARSAAAWRGPPAPTLRLLPARVDLADARREATVRGAGHRRLLLGLDERDLAPVELDPDRDPHLLVLGGGGAGKTAALRTYALEVMRSHTPSEAQVMLVDYRRSLLGEIPEEYLLDHLASASSASPALADLATHLERRLPGRGVTPRQIRDRSWWEGPEVFVLVDDYDLVATSRDSPVAGLEHLLAQARDVGLHVVVARHCGGASRSLHDPVLRSLRDLGAPGLLLPGSPEEGRVLGPLAPRPGPAGRGRLLTPEGGVEVLQVAWSGDPVGSTTRALRLPPRPNGRGPRGTAVSQAPAGR